jgi:hypothetical protein
MTTITRRGFLSFSLTIALLASACGTVAADPPPPAVCDEECKDEIALRALRETMKLAFNLTFQGKPVGTYDLSTPCPLGGRAQVTGTATSNAIQGATEVKLTYVLQACGYLFKDDEPKENYSMVLAGTVTQEGIIAVQPSATSALVMKSDAVVFAGTVHDPPFEYKAACPVELGQNGNILTGKICGRESKTDL